MTAKGSVAKKYRDLLIDEEELSLEGTILVPNECIDCCSSARSGREGQMISYLLNMYSWELDLS